MGAVSLEISSWVLVGLCGIAAVLAYLTWKTGAEMKTAVDKINRSMTNILVEARR